MDFENRPAKKVRKALTVPLPPPPAPCTEPLAQPFAPLDLRFASAEAAPFRSFAPLAAPPHPQSAAVQPHFMRDFICGFPGPISSVREVVLELRVVSTFLEGAPGCDLLQASVCLNKLLGKLALLRDRAGGLFLEGSYELLVLLHRYSGRAMELLTGPYRDRIRASLGGLREALVSAPPITRGTRSPRCSSSEAPNLGPSPHSSPSHANLAQMAQDSSNDLGHRLAALGEDDGMCEEPARPLTAPSSAPLRPLGLSAVSVSPAEQSLPSAMSLLALLDPITQAMGPLQAGCIC